MATPSLQSNISYYLMLRMALSHQNHSESDRNQSIIVPSSAILYKMRKLNILLEQTKNFKITLHSFLNQLLIATTTSLSFYSSKTWGHLICPLYAWSVKWKRRKFFQKATKSNQNIVSLVQWEKEWLRSMLWKIILRRLY